MLRATLWVALTVLCQTGRGQIKPSPTRLNPAKTQSIDSSTVVRRVAIPPDSQLNEAFGAFWRGQVILPARYFQQAADRAETLSKSTRLSLSARQVRLAQRAIFGQFSQLLAERFESSSTLSDAESYRVSRERLTELSRSLAEPNLPDSIRAGLLMAKGLLYKRMSRLTDSRQVLSTALKLFPDWAYLNAILGDIAIERSDFVRAEQLLGNSCRLDSTLLLSRYLLGWVYMKTNRLNEAERMGHQVIKLDSSFHPVYNLLGQLYEALHMDEQVELQYRTLFQKNRRWITGYTNLSNYYEDKGQLDRAEQIALKADSVHPETVNVYYRLASIYKVRADNSSRTDSTRSKEYRTKQVYFLNKCVDVDSAYTKQMGDYYFNKFTDSGYTQARRWYRLKLQFDPDDVFANYQLGETYRLTDQHKAAIPYYQRAILHNPDYVDAHAMLGECYGQLDQWSSSLVSYEKVMTLAPSDTANLYRLGYQCANVADSLLKVFQTHRAITVLEKGARLGHPQCADLVYGLKAEYDSADADMARYWYRRAALHIPFYKIAHTGLIRLYDEKKIEKDTSDYHLWQDIDQQQLKSISVDCPSKYGKRAVTLFFFNNYLPGVHPLAYEKERVRFEQYGAAIPDEIMRAIAKRYRIAKENNIPFFDLLYETKTSADFMKSMSRFYTIAKKDNDSFFKLLIETYTSERRREAIKYLYAYAKDTKRSFFDLLKEVMTSESDTRIKTITTKIDNLTKRVMPVPRQPEAIYLTWLDSLTHLQESRWALKKGSDEYRNEAANSYLTFGKEQWRLNTDRKGLLRAAKQAIRLDSTNGEAVRMLAVAWLLNPEGDSLQQHYTRFGKQTYRSQLFQNYFFDDLDSLRQTNSAIPLLDDFHKVLNTPYQQARRGQLDMASILRERDPAILKQAAQGYEIAGTKEGLATVRQLYRHLTTLYPDDTTFAVLEWQALLRINADNPLPDADSIRIEGLYTLFMKSQNARLVQQSIDSYVNYTDQFTLRKLTKLLDCEEKLVALHRHWVALSPTDESAYSGLSAELYRKAYFQFRSGLFDKALINADEGLSLALPGRADRYRAVGAMAQVYLGQFAGAEPELKRLSGLKWYGKSYPTYGDWMLEMYRLLRANNLIPPDNLKFRHLLVEVVHDDATLYENGLLTDADLLKGDVSQQRLWLTMNLTSTIKFQKYRDEAIDRQRVIKTMVDFGQTSALLNAARIINYRVQKEGISRAEALYFANESVALYDRIASRFSSKSRVTDTLAAGYGGLAYSFLKWGVNAEGLRLVKLAYQYNAKEDYTLTNLPLAYLLNNQFDKARTLYIDIAKRPWTADKRYKTYREVFLADFDDLKKFGVNHPDFIRIEALLKAMPAPKEIN